MTKDTQLSKFKEWLDYCGIEYLHTEYESAKAIYIECFDCSEQYATFQFLEEKLIYISCTSEPDDEIFIFPKDSIISKVIRIKGEKPC